MKKEYTEPSAELLLYEDDIITTSGGEDIDLPSETYPSQW